MTELKKGVGIVGGIGGLLLLIIVLIVSYYRSNLVTKDSPRGAITREVETRPLMMKAKVEAIHTYTYLSGSSLVDPMSLSIGIQQSIPYTYDSNLETASVYLETLLYDGWEIVDSTSDPAYMDYILRKKSTMARVIVLEGSMKIFDEIKGEVYE